MFLINPEGTRLLVAGDAAEGILQLAGRAWPAARPLPSAGRRRSVVAGDDPEVDGSGPRVALGQLPDRLHVQGASKWNLVTMGQAALTGRARGAAQPVVRAVAPRTGRLLENPRAVGDSDLRDCWLGLIHSKWATQPGVGLGSALGHGTCIAGAVTGAAVRRAMPAWASWAKEDVMASHLSSGPDGTGGDDRCCTSAC